MTKHEYLRRYAESLSSEVGTIIDDESFENDMAARYSNNKIETLITQLFCLWIKRQILIHRLNSRFECTMAISKSISPDNKIFLFHQYIEEVEALAKALKANTDHKVVTMHSGRNRDDRTAILKSFKSGENNMLVSCRVLDEGVDVPDANVAIFSAISKSPTQIIQRTGRILRPQKKKAILYILYAGSTVEAFLYGKAHELFEKVFPCKTMEWAEKINPINNSAKRDEEKPNDDDNNNPESDAVKINMPDFVLTAWRWYKVNGGICIDGEVENKSNRTFKYVYIAISVRDDSGNFLGVGNSILHPYIMAPSCFSIFEMRIDSVSHEINNILIKHTFKYTMIKA